MALIIKPLNLSVMTRPFEMNNRFFQCNAIIACLSFNDTNEFLSEPDIWKFIEQELGKDAPLDIVMPKSTGEVLVTGSYHSQKGNVRAGEAAFKIGALQKKLYIIGNRIWKKNNIGSFTMSEPDEFSEMPITYKNAFGGKEYPHNPLGKGFTTDYHAKTVQLPNIEDANNTITSIDNNPLPAGFGPIDMMWPQRQSKAGTYDEKWYKTLYPGLAADIDPTYFNTAPVDQWNSSYFSGGEEFSLYGMHKSRPAIHGRLPSIVPRCFVNLSSGNDSFNEVQMNLDTVWFFPHAEKVILIWHGISEIGTDDADDVKQIVAGYERNTDKRRTKEHYNSALQKRLDPENGHLYAIYEKDLIADGDKPGLIQILDNANQSIDENKLMANQRKKAEQERKNAKEKIDSTLKDLPAGIKSSPDANQTLTSLESDPFNSNPIDLYNYDPEAIAAFLKKQIDSAKEMKEKALAEAAAKKELLYIRFKNVCEKLGKNYDDEIAKLQYTEFKRPVVNTAEIITKLSSVKKNLLNNLENIPALDGTKINLVNADIDSCNLSPSMKALAKKCRDSLLDNNDIIIQRLKNTEEVSRESYLRFAHTLDKIPVHSSDVAERQKRSFINNMHNKSCSGKDYAGIDLSNMDLRGIDLSNTYFEGANLTNVNLSNANLKGAVFAKANFSNAILKTIDATGASFGGANLQNSIFTGSNLKDVILADAQLNATMLDNCIIAPIDISGAVFNATCFSGSKLSDCFFMDVSFFDCKFDNIQLMEIIFYKCILTNAIFTNALMQKTHFIETDCSGSDFKNANLSKSHFAMRCCLKTSDFTNANLDDVNLMECDLSNARFTGASMNGANLMKTKCTSSDFSGITGKRSMLSKGDFTGAKFKGANLMEANLQKGIFTHTDFTNASLYGAEVMRITVGNTIFTNTNLEMTKLANQDYL